MSTRQLDELWKLDMNMAHMLMEMPLRTCNAQPQSDPIDFPEMDSQEFRRLKALIRRMWVIAATHFEAKKTEHGWGIFMRNDPVENSKLVCVVLCTTHVFISSFSSHVIFLVFVCAGFLSQKLSQLFWDGLPKRPVTGRVRLATDTCGLHVIQTSILVVLSVWLTMHQ